MCFCLSLCAALHCAPLGSVGAAMGWGNVWAMRRWLGERITDKTLFSARCHSHTVAHPTKACR